MVGQRPAESSSLSRLRERAGVRARALPYGGQHVADADYDLARETTMKASGFQTLRFWNHEVLNETEAVMEKIRLFAETLTPARSRQRVRV
jgi:hypothetical protein